MRTLLELLAGMVNYAHDLVLTISKALGLGLSDKDLHFWVIGALGLAVFIVSDIAIRLLAKWSLSAISFIYTLTVLTVFVFAVEIEQAITRRGNMEFKDVTMGLYGFLVFVGIYLLFRTTLHMLRQRRKKINAHGR